MVTLNFQLDVDDDWPPVAVECMPCTPAGKLFRIENPPLFVKGLSVGDLISAAPDAEGRVWEWDHVEKSGRTTIWMLRLTSTAQGEFDAAIGRLRALGCNTTTSDALGCVAVDVPAECSIADVDSSLASIDPERVAVVFPSFRHDDSDVGES